MTETGGAEAGRRRLSWLALLGVLALWLVGGLVGALVAPLLTGPEDDDFADVADALSHSVLPALLSAAVIAVVVARLRWWPVVLRDGSRARPWAWLFVVGLLGAAVPLLDRDRLASAGAALVVALLVSVLAVAVSEELAFRGVVLRATRDHLPEFWAAVVTTLLFGAAHMINGGFGNVGQGVLTMLVGYLLYVARRVSGVLVVPIVLHAAWDFAVFSGVLGAGSSTSDSLFTAVVLLAVLTVAALATYRLWQRPEPEDSPAAA